MANTAVKVVRAEFRPARAFGAQATIFPDPIHNTTFAEARSKAREWADKAIDLYQVGDTEQTRHAVRLAETWLARMHAFEATSRSEPGSAMEPEDVPSRSESGTQDSAEIPVRPLIVVASPFSSPLIANHAEIRKRLLSRRGR
jgi:hypothetical protein